MKNFWRTVIALPLLFLALHAHAQSYSPIEVGAQASSLLLSDAVSGTNEQAGFGTRVTYNLFPILAFEAEGDFFPSNAPETQQRGGRVFAVLAGAKAGWRFRNVGIFAKARPGIINFSNSQVVTTGIQSNGIPFFAAYPGAHHTDLALDLGAVLEVNTSRRTMVRVDVGEMLVRYLEHSYPIPTTSGAVFRPGVVGNSLLVTVGFSYRLGEISERQPVLSGARRWETGVQYGLLAMGSGEGVGFSYFNPINVTDNAGFGGRLTYNFKRWLAMDSSVNYFYRDPHTGDAQRGGRIIQGSFGPKAGLHTQRVGVFLKARPGFLSYGGVHDSYYPPFPTTRLTHFALDLGGVLEFYPSPRTMIRFDVGHTIGFYNAQAVQAPVTLSPSGNLQSAGFHDNGMQMIAGFGWRF